MDSFNGLQNGSGDFVANPGAFGDLIKALEASGTGSGASGVPMVPEDLEMEAYTVLWQASHLKLLRHLPVIPAYSMNHEFTRITQYTSPDYSGFFREGGVPNSFEFRSQRQIEFIRPIGEGFAVSGPMEKVRSISGLGASNIIAIQQTTKVLALMQKMVKACYFANTLDFASGQTTHFRGIEQIQSEDEPSSIIDLAGETMTEDAGSTAAQQIIDNFGEMSHIMLAPVALKNFGRTIQAVRQVQSFGEDYVSGTAGVSVSKLRHMFGVSELVSDTFLNAKYSRYKNPPDYGATNPKPANAPVTPNEATEIAITTPVAAGTKFDTRELSDFGTYYYAVTADSAHSLTLDTTGESDPAVKGTLATPTGIVVTSGDNVEIAITTASDAASYKVYRAVATPTELLSYQMIGEIRNSGATVTFIDNNDLISHTKDTAGNIASTTTAFGLTLPTAVAAGKSKLKMQYPETVPDALKRVDLAPIHPREQAIVGDLAVNRLLLWYGAIEVTHPLRNVIFRNIGNRNL